MYAHMTRFSLAPMCDGFSLFVGSYLRVCVFLSAYATGVCCHMKCTEGQYCTGACVRCELQIEVELMKTTCHIFWRGSRGQEMKLSSSV